MLSTIYRETYKTPGRLSPLKLFDYFVSFEQNADEETLLPRCFPHYALHVSPRRELAKQREWSSLGFGPDFHQRDVEDEGEEIETKEALEDISKDETKEPLSSSLSNTKRGCSSGKFVKQPQRLLLYRREERDLYHSVSGQTEKWKFDQVSKFWEMKQHRFHHLKPKPTFLWNTIPSLDPVPEPTFVPKLPNLPEMPSGRFLVLAPC